MIPVPSDLDLSPSNSPELYLDPLCAKLQLHPLSVLSNSILGDSTGHPNRLLFRASIRYGDLQREVLI